MENTKMAESAKTNQSISNSLTIAEFAQLLWKKKFLIVLFVIVATMLGATYAMWVRPQFTSDALLQVNVKGTSSKATKAFGEMGAVLDLASPADAEIELIKSRMVLSYVVEAEHLYIWTVPVGFWDRLLHKEGRVDVDSLRIPETVRAK
jgi:tyrosine-protein kinase Etk/Wzc